MELKGTAVCLLHRRTTSQKIKKTGYRFYYLRRNITTMSDTLISTPKNIVMSGIRPTGFLHLGNYFGAIRNYIKMQNEFECYFMVADLHSLTPHPDTKKLKQHVYRVVAENIACSTG